MKHARARSDARETMGIEADARGGKRKAADRSTPSRRTTVT
jgi:hypothetical protein